jgi:hypothetical protein
LTRRKFIDVLKWAWIVVVLLGAGWYFYRHYQEISQYLGTISIIRLILCFLLLMAGKLALSDISRLSLKKVYYSMPYSEALTITSHPAGKVSPGRYLAFCGKVWSLQGKRHFHKKYHPGDGDRKFVAAIVRRYCGRGCFSGFKQGNCLSIH